MFKKKEIQLIRFDQNLCNADVNNNEILFVRVSDMVTTPTARFEVPMTHDAIVIKGGGDMRYYKSGTYNVFDDKKEIKNWKQGLSVEVIYVPKDTRVLIKWGTPNRLRYRDEASGKVITVGAHGEFDISVSNIEQFVRKVVGATKEFDLSAFRKRFSETVATEFADVFLKTIRENHYTYDRFMENKKEISMKVGEILSKNFTEQWGLSVLNFLIADFDLLDEDMDQIEEAAKEKNHQEKVKEYLKELERLDDKKWEREKYLKQLELEDKQAYYEVLKVVGSHMEEEKKENICPKCGYTCKSTDVFCPHCGKSLKNVPLICPTCGHKNDASALFCSKCGKKLSE